MDLIKAQIGVRQVIWPALLKREDIPYAEKIINYLSSNNMDIYLTGEIAESATKNSKLSCSSGENLILSQIRTDITPSYSQIEMLAAGKNEKEIYERLKKSPSPFDFNGTSFKVLEQNNKKFQRAFRISADGCSRIKLYVVNKKELEELIS